MTRHSVVLFLLLAVGLTAMFVYERNEDQYIRSLSFKPSPIAPGQDGMAIVEYDERAFGMTVRTSSQVLRGSEVLAGPIEQEFLPSMENRVQIIPLAMPADAGDGLHELFIQAVFPAEMQERNIPFEVKAGAANPVEQALQ